MPVTFREYIDSKVGHRDRKSLKNALDAWFAEVQKANWKNTDEVRRNYTWASIISSDRVVFDILSNRYRLVTAVDFEKGIVWIKWIGTHKECDKIDVSRLHAKLGISAEVLIRPSRTTTGGKRQITR